MRIVAPVPEFAISKSLATYDAAFFLVNYFIHQQKRFTVRNGSVDVGKRHGFDPQLVFRNTFNVRPLIFLPNFRRRQEY